MTDYALKIPKFKEIVGTSSYILTINGHSKQINNTNELLGYLHGVYGVKTGFTGKAGRCLVTSTKRGDLDIICVVLGADTKKIRSQDSMKLIEYAFRNFQLYDVKNKIKDIFESEKIENNVYVQKGKQEQIVVELEKKSTLIAIRIDDIPSIESEISYSTEIEAPVESGYNIGIINIKIDDNIIFSQNILLKEGVERKNYWDYLLEMLTNFLSYCCEMKW